MIVLKKDNNLTFQIPTISNSNLFQLKNECVLNGKVYNNKFFKSIIYKVFNGYKSHKSLLSDMQVDFKKVQTDNDYKFSDKEIYNFDSNIAYYMDYSDYNISKGIIYKFYLLNPLITKFFLLGFDYDKNKNLMDNKNFVFIDFVDNDAKNIDELEHLLSLPISRISSELLYKYYPNLAYFYYNVLSYISFKEIESYNLVDLNNLKEKTKQMKINTIEIDQLLSYEQDAINNTKILKLIQDYKRI